MPIDEILREAPPPENGLHSITASELDAMQIPPRRLILSPWWGDGEQPIVWGWRGAGKSWVTLGCAAALAAGGKFLSWEAPAPVVTLFVDGEMMARRLQGRMGSLARSCELYPGKNLHILTPDVLGRFLNLWKEEDRQAVENHAAAVGAQVVIFDNVATLYRTNSAKLVSNAAEWWEPIQTWLVGFRSRGIATLTALHTGKDGTGPRGTSAIEDTVEISLKVAEAENRKQSDGAWFTVEFTKTRDYLGADGGKIEAKLEGDCWTVLTREDSKAQKRTERDAAHQATVEALQTRLMEYLKNNAATPTSLIHQAVGGRWGFMLEALQGLKAQKAADYERVGKKILWKAV